MKKHRYRMQRTFSFFAILFFLTCFGCAAGTSMVEPMDRNESFQQADGNPSERQVLAPAGAGFQEELISSPFGNIPREKQIAEDQLSTEPVEPLINEVPVKNQPAMVVEEKKSDSFNSQQLPETVSNQKIEKKDLSSVSENVSENIQQQLSSAGDVVLNFDNADLYEVIRTLAEILRINYIVDPNVRGRVTIQTSGKLRPDELFPVFFQILEANGLTAVKDGNIYKILRMKEATQLPLSTRTGRHAISEPGERMIIQIIPLRFISANEMTTLLTPFVTAGGTIVSHQNTNTILVVDQASNIEKILRLKDVFDIDLFKNVDYRFIKLQYMNAEDASKTINEIIASYGANIAESFKAIPLPRINSLLLISKQPQIISKVQTYIRELDIAVEDVEPRIFVYSVKNGASAELSNLLNAVFAKSSSDQTTTLTPQEPETQQYRQEGTQELFPEITTSDRQVRTVAGERISAESSGTLRGDVKITPDEIRNTLIIEATPMDYRVIEAILTRIDVLPRQVLIEVTIAEITLDASTELGIEWRFDRGEDFVSGLQTGATLGSAGLNFSYAILDQAKKWTATVSALAQKGKVNILSSPSVLASDNKEAKINVSTEIPVATTTYTYDNVSTDRLLQTSIQYRNTGVILSVTPHINEYGLVSMDVNQEVSEQAEQVEVGEGDKRFSFFKRSVNTTLTVKNGQTIVIGGLIRETKSDNTAGIPCIGEVPVLSYFFGKKSTSSNKTELIIFITPKVIATFEDVDIVSEEFRNRIGYDYENFKVPGSR